jgi:hypothetical protein
MQESNLSDSSEKYCPLEEIRTKFRTELCRRHSKVERCAVNKGDVMHAHLIYNIIRYQIHLLSIAALIKDKL